MNDQLLTAQSMPALGIVVALAILIAGILTHRIHPGAAGGVPTRLSDQRLTYQAPDDGAAAVTDIFSTGMEHLK